MSNGRVELGLGAGWYLDEHRSYGVPFPTLGERFDILTEQLSIITGLWNTPIGDTFSFDGSHYQVKNSPALPKPVQTPPPIIVGGGGPKRTPMLAARFAAEFNLPFQNTQNFTAQRDRVRSACDSIGRNPDSLVYSSAQVICVGATEADISRRAGAIGRDVEELKTNGLCGTPAEVLDKIKTWEAHGAERLYVQMLDLSDLDQIALIGTEILPHL
jgi:alkanesulfonate monooxygenase